MINFIQIDPNGLCNAGCWFCPVSLIGNPKEHISQMSPELYEDIIKQIHHLKGDLINPNLHFVYATGLPFGPPTHERYKDLERMPAYRRVDIGFSYDLLEETRKRNSESMFRHIKNAWISLEVFNMLGINNTISYLWIRDINNRVYGIPNYLTNRRLNLKISMNF